MDNLFHLFIMKSFLFTLSVLLLCTACVSTPLSSTPPSAQKVKVATSFYPLHFLTERIAGETATVTQVIPGGTEPHDYEPTPRQLAEVYDSQLLVMNGQGLDPWADRVRDLLEQKHVNILAATQDAQLLSAVFDEHHDEEEDVAHDIEGEFDPHVWLDPVFMEAFAVRIRDALISVDRLNADIYRRQAEDLMTDLRVLDAYFHRKLASCEKKKVIVSHDAFRYLAQRYGFETIALAGISPDEEPSPKHIADIIDTAKREDIKVIFFEALLSPKIADLVAREAGAQALVLNPIESLTIDEAVQGESYLSLMRQNADNLSIALQCQ